jgi:hypothetical protein
VLRYDVLLLRDGIRVEARIRIMSRVVTEGRKENRKEFGERLN